MLQVLRDARGYLARPGGWTQGKAVGFDEQKGGYFPMCASAAVEAAAGILDPLTGQQPAGVSNEQVRQIMPISSAACRELVACLPDDAPYRLSNYGARVKVIWFNDSNPDRLELDARKARVIKVFDCAIEKRTKRYGGRRNSGK